MNRLGLNSYMCGAAVSLEMKCDKEATIDMKKYPSNMAGEMRFTNKGVKLAVLYMRLCPFIIQVLLIIV